MYVVRIIYKIIIVVYLNIVLKICCLYVCVVSLLKCEKESVIFFFGVRDENFYVMFEVLF